MKLRHIGLLMLATLWSSLVLGQGYPSKPVKIIVPFTAGSATDILARTYGQKLSEMWKQPVAVANHPGAGGTIGAGLVAKAAPDGYTLLVHSAAQAYNPSIYASLPYDTNRDFIDVAALGGQPNVLVVAPSTGIKSMAELIALAKQKPGQLNFSSAGVASTSYLSAEIFKQEANINIVHIPYKGAPEATTAVIRNDAQMYFAPIPATQELSATGKVRAIAINSAKRVPQLPEVPTVAETLPKYKYESWFGVFAPAGTPQPILTKVSEDIAKVLEMPDVKEKLLAQGSIPAPTTPSEFDAINKADTERYGKILKDAGITPQ